MSIVESVINKARGSAERTRATDALDKQTAPPPAYSRPALSIDLKTSGIPVAGETQRHLNEFRSLKRSVLQRIQSAPAVASRPTPNVVMVTSALPGDGKTSVSTNLALATSIDRDYEVLLVDGDVAKRHLTGLFGASDAPGLTDLLTDPHASAHEYVYPTNIPHLSFLPAGAPTKGAPELFASARTGTVLAELARWRPRLLVVIDSAPVLLASEPAILSSWAGQVLVVIRAGVTLKDSALEAVAELGNGEHVGLVMNDWKPVALAERDRHGRYAGYYDAQP